MKEKLVFFKNIAKSPKKTIQDLNYIIHDNKKVNYNINISRVAKINNFFNLS